MVGLRARWPRSKNPTKRAAKCPRRSQFHVTCTYPVLTWPVSFARGREAHDERGTVAFSSGRTSRGVDARARSGVRSTYRSPGSFGPSVVVQHVWSPDAARDPGGCDGHARRWHQPR